MKEGRKRWIDNCKDVVREGCRQQSVVVFANVAVIALVVVIIIAMVDVVSARIRMVACACLPAYRGQ